MVDGIIFSFLPPAVIFLKAVLRVSRKRQIQPRLGVDVAVFDAYFQTAQARASEAVGNALQLTFSK
jgi:hypothetical protein